MIYKLKCAANYQVIEVDVDSDGLENFNIAQVYGLLKRMSDVKQKVCPEMATQSQKQVIKSQDAPQKEEMATQAQIKLLMEYGVEHPEKMTKKEAWVLTKQLKG